MCALFKKTLLIFAPAPCFAISSTESQCCFQVVLDFLFIFWGASRPLHLAPSDAGRFGNCYFLRLCHLTGAVF